MKRIYLPEETQNPRQRKRIQDNNHKKMKRKIDPVFVLLQVVRTQRTNPLRVLNSWIN